MILFTGCIKKAEAPWGSGASAEPGFSLANNPSLILIMVLAKARYLFFGLIGIS
jgi:hypothetical protein